MTDDERKPAHAVEQPLDLVVILGVMQDTLERLVEFRTEATRVIHDLRGRVDALEARSNGGS